MIDSNKPLAFLQTFKGGSIMVDAYKFVATMVAVRAVGVSCGYLRSAPPFEWYE